MKTFQRLQQLKSRRFPKTRKELLTRFGMADIVLCPKAEPESRWSLFSWSPGTLLKATVSEKRLLGRFLNFTDEAHHAKPTAQLGRVDIGNDRHINTLTIKSTRPESEGPAKNLVITHGYGAGLGFFYRNYAQMAESGYNIYAVDWLGMANSSRPPFPKDKRDATEDESVQQAEEFFVESLEDWRVKMGLDKMVLFGHSLGGYLSTCYALKHPEAVEKLLLISPAGVPSPPPPVEPPMASSSFANMITSLFQKGYTPMSIIRGIGPFGPSLVRRYTSRRFAHLDPQELNDLDSYLFNISAQSGSGEYALSRLLLPVYQILPSEHSPVAHYTTVFGSSRSQLRWSTATRTGWISGMDCMLRPTCTRRVSRLSKMPAIICT